jgi:hypothetical protein
MYLEQKLEKKINDLIYLFVFVFLVSVFNKEFNYMNNNCENKLTFTKKSWCSPFKNEMEEFGYSGKKGRQKEKKMFEII